MSQSGRNSGWFWGALLILLGVLFLLDNFYMLDFGEVVSTYWPLILVAIGIKILLDKRRQRDELDADEVYLEDSDNKSEGGGADSLSESNVFGDIDLRSTSENFRGGSVNNVFGDVKIDLASVKLSQEITKLFVSGIFGDITIVTPKDIPLKTKSNAVAGDITVRGEKREGLFPNMTREDSNYTSAANKLDIQCSIVFGSINIF